MSVLMRRLIPLTQVGRIERSYHGKYGESDYEIAELEAQYNWHQDFVLLPSYGHDES